ncbi:hypothetical protein ACXYTP_15265 [Tsukamurella ocularis]
MQWCHDPAYRADLYRRRYDPHVRPVNELVDSLRRERPGAFVPYVAPTYGGTNARVLALLQDPGPKTKDGKRNGSRMLCIENADPTAERYKALLAASGIDVCDVQAWNAFPWEPTAEVRRGHRRLAPTDDDLADATDALARLVERLPRLRVVLLHGVHAKAAWPRLRLAYPDLARGVRAVDSWHPLAANPAYKSPAQVEKYARELDESFAKAASHLRDPRQMFYGSSAASPAGTVDDQPEETDQAGRPDQAQRTPWGFVTRRLGDLRDRYSARTSDSPTTEHPPADEAPAPERPEQVNAGEPVTEPSAPASTASPTNDGDFDREIEQYRAAEELLQGVRRDLRSQMDECRGSRDRMEDYRQLSEEDRSLANRLADLERAKATYLKQRHKVVLWAEENGESTDGRAFRGSIVTIRYSDGEHETFVLTERDIDTDYETVSHESTLGERVKLKRVGDSIELANGDHIVVTAIQPGFRISAPTR